MKHAYLIIAHNEFEVLQKLIFALDDSRNDIYVHFDKKVIEIPTLQTQYADLFVIANRIDVRWGHVSQIECEYALFEEAINSKRNYSRYHLISGTHFPLKTQDDIHSFFERHKDNEVLSYIYTNEYEVNMKLGKRHFFLKNYKNKMMAQIMWKFLIKLQYIFHLNRKSPNVTIKANNWICLTNAAVEYIISKKSEVLSIFKYSFCGDEFFIPYLFENANGQFNMIDCKELLYNDFEGGSTPRIIKDEDYDFLISSDYLFARKFSENQIGVVNRLLHNITS